MEVVEELGRRVPDCALSQDPDEPFPEIMHVRSPLYGELVAPESLAEFVAYVENECRNFPWLAGWRGQSDIRWPQESTAARRILGNPYDVAHGGLGNPDEWPVQSGRCESSEQPLEDAIRDYEGRLLRQARGTEHGFHRGRRLTDLELLSVLRHYGAATRLMDLSRNVFVALWFACQASTDGYGLVVGVESNTAPRVDDRRLDRPIPHLLDELKPEEGEMFYVWEPRHLFERMRVQQSVFAFGSAVRRPWGSAPYLTSEMVLVAVPPGLKATVAHYGSERLLGYDGRSLFPDLAGFGEFHGAGQGFEDAFFIDI